MALVAQAILRLLNPQNGFEVCFFWILAVASGPVCLAKYIE